MHFFCASFVVLPCYEALSPAECVPVAASIIAFASLSAPPHPFSVRFFLLPTDALRVSKTFQVFVPYCRSSSVHTSSVRFCQLFTNPEGSGVIRPVTRAVTAPVRAADLPGRGLLTGPAAVPAVGPFQRLPVQHLRL